MFCKKCGKELGQETAFCPDCGAPVASTGNERQKMPSSDSVSDMLKTKSSAFYVTLILAVLECILPFRAWVKVPLYNSIGNFFGAGSDISSYSLFGYIGTIQDNDSMFTSVFILVLCFGTLLGVACNILYIVKGLKGTGRYDRFGRTGALLMTIVALAFLIVMGLDSLIIKLIKITMNPFLLLILSIVNRNLIKSQNKG